MSRRSRNISLLRRRLQLVEFVSGIFLLFVFIAVWSACLLGIFVYSVGAVCFDELTAKKRKPQA